MFRAKRKGIAVEGSMQSLSGARAILLKSDWSLCRHAKRPLQRNSGCAQLPFIEKSANQRYAMRHAAWRSKRWQRMRRIGSPIAACLIYFYKSRAQRQRGMPGEICYDQHLVAQGRHEQQVNS
jgi:hypothetical protein